MIPSGVKVHLASQTVDFRKGPDRLVGLVRDTGADPFNGSFYVFRAKRADRLKIVWWDGMADGEDRIVQAPAPDHLIVGGIPTEALLAQVAVSKYADGLPLYRQEEIYAGDGVKLDRSLMAQWMGRLGFELEPLAQYVLHTVKRGERIFADEPRLPMLAPGSGKVRTAWLWAYARDDRPFGGSGPPMVAYRFEDSRSGDCVARHLDGYHGILQVDGYAAYNRLGKDSGQ